jgi:hypothetical protein
VNIKTTLKTTVAAAALFAIAAPVSAGTVSNSNDTASVTLSGHFNKGVLWMSDGNSDRVSIVDNTNSQTRGRIVVNGKLNEAVSYTALTEWAMTSNDSNDASPSSDTLDETSTAAGNDSFFTKRHNMIRMAHKSFGSVRLGHTSEATDGITENSKTGAGDIVYGGATNIGNAIHLRRSNAANGAQPSSVVVGDLLIQAGEGTRTDTIRYDTPTFAGFSAAASFQADQSSSYALRYGGKFAGISVAAGYGYSAENAGAAAQGNMQGGSIALGHDSGLSLRASGGITDFDAQGRDNGTTVSVGAGYKANLVSAGSTNFAVDWTRSENGSANDDKIDLFSVGVVQETDAGVKFYLGYQLFSAEQADSVDYDDASTVMAGTKVFF